MISSSAMNQSVGYVGYQAKSHQRSKSTWRRWARRSVEFVRHDLVFNTLLYPYGVWQHRKLLKSAVRSQSHTYTCFFRSPPQLEAIAGPVIDYLRQGGASGPLRILVFACSSGAEAYTLASVLMKSRPGLEFTIEASDLHEEMVERGRRGVYTRDEVLHGDDVAEDFVAATFDAVDGQFVVKPEIRARVSFSCANLVSDDLPQRFGPADIVLAQNVLFHLDPPAARAAFVNVAGCLKPRAALLIEGMELNQKLALTREFGLKPLATNCRAIYERSRIHIAAAWWRHYYGAEPYSVLRSDRVRRYGSIFLK